MCHRAADVELTQRKTHAVVGYSTAMMNVSVPV